MEIINNIKSIFGDGMDESFTIDPYTAAEITTLADMLKRGFHPKGWENLVNIEAENDQLKLVKLSKHAIKCFVIPCKKAKELHEMLYIL